jgi:hypothetical protein
LEIGRGSIRSHRVENWLWEILSTCRNAEYGMMVFFELKIILCLTQFYFYKILLPIVGDRVPYCESKG